MPKMKKIYKLENSDGDLKLLGFAVRARTEAAKALYISCLGGMSPPTWAVMYAPRQGL